MDISHWAHGSDGPAWPVNEQGEKIPARQLRHTLDNVADADMTISLLAAYGIPCFPYYDGEGVTGKVISGFSGFGTSLYVPETMFDDAEALLNAEIVEDEENKEE
ncbi:MAG: hypothetical protein II458_01910 [Oscillospiraceae bacterium]|nr:hypothetical protein [Oscillospiraceae bacterium]